MLSKLNLLKRGIRNQTAIPSYLLRQVQEPPLIRNNSAYSLYLLMKSGSYRPSHPDLSEVIKGPKLETLDTVSSYQNAIKEVRSLGLHPHFHGIKTWDALIALKSILNNTGPSHSVLDAGGALYSPLVEWLYMYGYDNLHVCNIEFDKQFQRGPITYRDADFLNGEFEENTFDVVASLSVIEHGLDVRATLEEFYKILKSGGILILSTDYWDEKIDTKNERTRYGEQVQKWNIFDREGIIELLEIAESIGFEVPDNRNVSVSQPTIEWKGKSYTFIYIGLRV